MVLQKHNRHLIPSILIQHLGDHVQESIRQGAALLGADLNATHTVDAQIVTGLAGVIQRNGNHRTPLGANTALDAVFVCRRVEGGGFYLLLGGVSGNLNRYRIVCLCHHIGRELTAEGFILCIGAT